MTIATTVDELRAALAHAPGGAPVLLVLHVNGGPPRAGWLGSARYDPDGGTFDLHDDDATMTPGYGIATARVKETL